MIVIAILPAVLVIVGLLVYALTSHKQVGLIMFGCGLLAIAFLLSGRTMGFR